MSPCSLPLTSKSYHGKATYYQTPGGKVVTFGQGTVAGGESQFALMPLCHEEAQKILSAQ